MTPNCQSQLLAKCGCMICETEHNTEGYQYIIKTNPEKNIHFQKVLC